MSGFCGYFSFLAGIPPKMEDMQAMDKAMDTWGPIHAAWQDESLAVSARLNPLCAQDNVDSVFLLEPDLMLVGHVRLDGRAQLLHRLGQSSQSASMTDIQIFAAAWRKWGPNCTEYVYGDWICAVWDRQQQRLWLGRDAAGNTGLYYAFNHRRLVFATSINAVLAHPTVSRQLNHNLLVEQLLPQLAMSDETATVYQEIFRLPGGYAIHADREGRVNCDNWWYPEKLGEIAWNTEDCHAAFRELYAECVQDRLRGNDGLTGIMLSAGLDSGSVAALAAPHLASTGQRLMAYVSVPAFAPDGAPAYRQGHEGALARKSAEHIGNIDLIEMACANVSVVDSIKQMLDTHGRPTIAAINYHWLHEILRFARTQNVRVMLTGQGGNATVSWSGSGVDQSTSSLLSCMRSRIAGQQTPLLPVIKQQLLKPARGCRDRLAGVNTVGRQLLGLDSALRPRQFAHYLRGHCASVLAGIHAPSSKEKNSIYTRFRLGRLASAGTGSNWMELGAANGMDVRDPTRDRRMIEFCWQVPDRIFWANNTQRGLIRDGMSGALPAEVMKSNQKGLQAADIGYRILAEQDYIHATLDALQQHRLASEWVNVPKIRAALVRLGRGVTPHTTQQEGGGIILRGLSMGLFLSRHG